MVGNKVFQKVLFTPNECENIISLNKENLQRWKNTDREYKSASIMLNDTTEWIFEKLKNFFEETIGTKIVKLKEEIHFHTFSVGNRFDIHNDNMDSRLFSVGVLLNDNFEGGDFKLYTANEIVLNKMVGNSYIFDVKIPHEISSINSGTRYSLIWFIQNNNIKPMPTKLI